MPRRPSGTHPQAGDAAEAERGRSARARARGGPVDGDEMLAEVIRACPVPVVTLDGSGRVSTWNPAAEHLFGWTADEVLGRPAPFLDEADRGGPTGLVERARGGEPRVGGETRCRRRDGSSVAVSLWAAPLRAEPGDVLGTVVVAAGLPAARAAGGPAVEEDLLAHGGRLATLGTLLAGVAHELNNPLALIAGHAALLRTSVAPGTVADRAGKIIQAAERCARIVRNFLAIARQDPPERQPVAVNEAVEEALELVGHELHVNDVEVVLDLASNLPSVWADAHQIHQVVVNLVTNAVHAMREAPGPRRLTLRTRYDAARCRVRLEVGDTGPGIPPEMHARIFEPFFTTKPLGEGTGLGLALCRGIVDGHGGTITVESRPGHGAVFRVELPVDAARRSIALRAAS